MKTTCLRWVWLLQVKYVTIAGRFVKGVKLTQEGSWLAKFAGAGYQQASLHVTTDVLSVAG